MQNLGIIQGRLTPSEGRGIQFFPKAEWENEFPAAKGLGFENIEWVFDYADYANNPLWTREGCKKICNIIEQSGVAVHTVCFDYFMRRPFYKHLDDVALREENLRFFKNIADNLALVGGHIMELPLVDDAAIQRGDERGAALEFLREASNLAPPNLAVAIETDMPPGAFRSFLEDVGRNNVKANYDLGDSVGRGYDPWDEICSLGAYVENVHIKDKPLHGSTVALGKGVADFDTFFSALAYTNYSKGITLQVARGKDGEEKKYISEQIQFVKPFVEKYLTGGLKMKNVLGRGGTG